MEALYKSRLWESNQLGQLSPRATSLGVGVALIYAFTKISFAEWIEPVEPVMLLLVAGIFFSSAGQLRRTFPVWLLVPAVLVPIITWGHTYLSYPELAASSPRADHLARHFLFVFMAWLLGGSVRNVLTLWLLGGIGLLFAPWILGAGWLDFVAAARGERVDFGIQNAQHMGLLHGAAALGLIIFAKRILMAGRHRALRIGVWLLALSYCLFAVFASQTRAILLALVLALLAAAVVFLATLLCSSSLLRSESGGWPLRKGWLRWIGIILLIVGLASLLGIYGARGALDRMESESSAISPLLQGEFDDVPANSIGLRIHSWRAATEWIAEKPILGWGPRGGALVMKKTEWLQSYTGGRFGHLHSSYFEVATRYGLAGMAIYFALALWFGVRLWVAWRHGRVQNDFALFFLCFFGYWLVANMFESYLFYWTGTYLFNMICGGMLTLIWKDQVVLGNDIVDEAHI